MLYSFVCYWIVSGCFNALNPIFSLSLALCMREERFTLVKLVAIIIAVAGGSLLINLDIIIKEAVSDDDFDPSEIYGYLFAFLNCLSNAIGRPIQRV